MCACVYGMKSKSSLPSTYWKESIKLVLQILSFWFFVSFGCGILFKDFLDQYSLGGAPLGFWMAQQGSIICFVVLLVVYARWMNKLDEKYGFGEEDES
jgi:putative solute:sodium symporter small subunit